MESSSKWVVTIDHAYQIFSTEAEARTIYDMVGGNPDCEGDELAETAFGSASMQQYNGDPASLPSWVTTECDLIQYMADTRAELDRRVEESRKKWQAENPNGLKDLFGDFFLDA